MYTLISLKTEHETLKKGSTKLNTNYKYVEINGKMVFGALSSIIPFMNHNPTTRALFCMAQSKQAVGVFSSNFNKRMDKGISKSNT